TGATPPSATTCPPSPTSTAGRTALSLTHGTCATSPTPHGGRATLGAPSPSCARPTPTFRQARRCGCATTSSPTTTPPSSPPASPICHLISPIHPARRNDNGVTVGAPA